MKKISIKNFRVFKDQQEMEFKPITILVGPNNSGKSTIFKSLKLINFDTSSFSLPYFIDSRLGTNFVHTESNILSDNMEEVDLNFANSLKYRLINSLIKYLRWYHKFDKIDFDSKTLEDFGLDCCKHCAKFNLTSGN
jgi:AAA15 family ATPase/GTPase